MDIAVLEAEHAELMDLRAQLLDLLKSELPAGSEISALRWRMSRQLLAHLAKEDSHLYPMLKANPDTPTAGLAARYEREIGDLAARWQAFILDWDSRHIVADWAGFRMATLSILDLLAARIKCEERDLYPRCRQMQQSTADRKAG